MTRVPLRIVVAALGLAVGAVCAQTADAARASRSKSSASKAQEAAAATAAAAAATAAALSAAHGAPTAPALAHEAFDDEPIDAGELQGKVTRVVDGDTLWFVREGASRPMKIRIEGIDAPEICQDYGVEARRALANRVLGREVRIKVRAVDDWGRRIAHVWDGDLNIGQRLVRDGMAWSIRYRWDRGPYVADERMAQSFFRGLHAATGKAEMPRDFRQRHGSCKTDGPDVGPTGGGGKGADGRRSGG